MIKKFKSFSEPKVNIDYYPNGQKKSEYWYLNGNRHKEDGPALQEWYENGQISIEVWYLNGKYHREDGPAEQDWYDNGQIRVESWFLNYKNHRENGPAYQYWNENGQKKSEYWRLNGIHYEREEWIDELRNIGSKHYEEQKMLYDLEKYNL